MHTQVTACLSVVRQLVAARERTTVFECGRLYELEMAPKLNRGALEAPSSCVHEVCLLILRCTPVVSQTVV